MIEPRVPEQVPNRPDHPRLLVPRAKHDPTDTPKPVSYTHLDVYKRQEQVASHRLSALFSLALAMGMRRGEIVGLRWEHLDLDAGIVRVREQLQRLKKKSPTDAGLVVASLKTDRSRRTLKLPGSLIEELKAHARAQKAERLNCLLYTSRCV